ncbi:DUF2351 [Nesidiocoris tenuis]|nr:DUF2351 [Nesidiocoris tenuis]
MSRALPLPTNGEMDFFCHQHSGHKLSSLNPGLTDIFYDHLYFLIHTDHLLQGSDAAKFECFNCSTTLGKIEKKAVKIWNSDAFIQNSVYDPHKCVPRYHQFLSGLFNLTEDVPAQMNKFVFICDGDRANETYTRMWVLDRSLMLSECESDSREVDLNCKIVKKVLYSHHAELSSEVDDFIKSPTALSISLSPSGQEILLKVLSFMSRNIPVEFSIVNGMKVSYLMFDDDINWDDL